MNLTPRQQQIAALVAEGLSSRQIAERLGIAEQTVRIHRHQIHVRLGTHNAAQVARLLGVTLK